MGNLSMRDTLIEKGVTEESAIRAHMKFILDTEETTGRKLDLSRYKPNPSNLSMPMMG